MTQPAARAACGAGTRTCGHTAVQETVRMICVFTPALVGQEVHDEEGAHPLLDADTA